MPVLPWAIRFSATTVTMSSDRLRKTGRFDQVDVLKRFASIEDPSRITVVIVVNEGPVRIDVPDDPESSAADRQASWHHDRDGDADSRRRGRVRTHLWCACVVCRRDWSARPCVAAAELGWREASGRRVRPAIHFGAAVRGCRPALASSGFTTRDFDLDDTRRRAWARAERVVGPVRMGGTAEWQRVSFAGSEDDVRSGGVDVTLDTRRDPQMPRNAVLASASWTRLSFRSGGDVNRTRARRREATSASSARPCSSSVRSWKTPAGRCRPPSSRFSAARRICADSGRESRPATRWWPGRWSSAIPLSSPISVGRFGVNAFVDTGAVSRARRPCSRPVIPYRDRRRRVADGDGVAHGSLGRTRSRVEHSCAFQCRRFGT